ncbi:uncharacterized protein LOC131303675 isoform X2 [Rhododendron vialii]|uniref:uncharacterized protein LOC131303675 isoform X2 n=1 Tax=Rhododendron vialii TaxID=182163 RepID=UPI00265F31D6|nr:uncharacterized protein LOC131303675 isoform X2 [Rhododendron vialii]
MFTTSSSKGKTGTKREGRQRGTVRKYPILGPSFHPRPDPRFTNRPDSPLAAGLFAKVSQKPTNQSKFTGKCSRPRCGRCHTYPVSKSRTKEKGTQKLQSCDVVSNHRLVRLWAVDSNPRLKFAGFSASGVLAHLEREYLNMDDDDDYVDEVYEESFELAYHDSLELEIASGAVDIKDWDNENKGDVEVEDLGFYDAEIVSADQDEDEDGGNRINCLPSLIRVHFCCCRSS